MSLKKLSCAFLTLAALPAFASPPKVEVSPLECLPLKYNAAIAAAIDPEVAGSSVRLYFRRLNPVGAFYYNEMFAKGSGAYWSVFPQPEERKQHLLTDDWWEVLKDRDWMEGKDRQWLEDYLEQQQHEAAEYYVGVYDALGALLGRSDTMLVEVWPADRCHEPLTPEQAGWAKNLTVGETTDVQARRCLFHWLCEGVVTRIGRLGVLRADECCRACVVAALMPLAAGGVALAILPPPEDVSPETLQGNLIGFDGNADSDSD